MIGFYNYTVIPTYIGFLSGIAGICFSFSGKPAFAVYCLLFCGLCDMFDGKIARTRTRTVSEQRFGIQIDSLSDLVCFGVLPATVGVAVGMNRWYYFPILGLYILCALIRLAYFNVTEEERQDQETGARKWYEGLPVTSVALIFPAIYPFRWLFGIADFSLPFAILMAIIAVAFVSPFRLRKPDTKGLIIMLVIGSLEMIALVLVRYLRLIGGIL